MDHFAKMEKHKENIQGLTPSSTRKKKTGGTISYMTFDELIVAKEQAVKANKVDSVILYLEQMIKICEDATAFADLFLELADLYFEKQSYDKALRMYGEFVALYPGSNQIEYAEYKAILCSFLCTLDEERDQTRTEETITRANNFLERENIFVEYSGKVRKILKQCYEKLTKSDLLICQFLLNQKASARNNYANVDRRIEAIRTEYIPHIPYYELLVLQFEIEVAEKKKDKNLINELQLSLKESITLCGDIAQELLADNYKTRWRF